MTLHDDRRPPQLAEPPVIPPARAFDALDQSLHFFPLSLERHEGFNRADALASAERLSTALDAQIADVDALRLLFPFLGR